MLELADQPQTVTMSAEEIENENTPVASSANDAMRMLGRQKE